MKPLAVAILLASSIRLWSQDATHGELLSKEAEAKFQTHVEDLSAASAKIEGDLRLSIPDERLLLHLRHRGFSHLASLVYNDRLYTLAGSALFMPEESLKSCTREEGVAEELLSRAMVARLAANNYACFQILKELAPTPEAMKFEAQAKELSAKIFVYKPTTGYNPSEAEFLRGLESIRILFDQLSALPKLTTQQLADERAEVAVLSPREYREGRNENSVLPPHSAPLSTPRWIDRELKWHREWDHQGYFLAFSELSNPGDYMQLKMVVNLRGGIFEWNREYSGSHFGPDSYESKLTESDFQNLKDFVAKLPPTDATGERNHFVVSFVEDGRWTTRTYNSFPAGNLFESLLKRMRHQAQIEHIVSLKDSLPSDAPANDVIESLKGSIPSDGTLK